VLDDRRLDGLPIGFPQSTHPPIKQSTKHELMQQGFHSPPVARRHIPETNPGEIVLSLGQLMGDSIMD